MKGEVIIKYKTILCESTLNKKIFYLCPRGAKNKQTHKQNQGKPFSDYKETQSLRARELFLCGKMRTNSHPRLFSASFA